MNDRFGGYDGACSGATAGRAAADRAAALPPRHRPRAVYAASAPVAPTSRNSENKTTRRHDDKNRHANGLLLGFPVGLEKRCSD